jgi:hypothetical protein
MSGLPLERKPNPPGSASGAAEASKDLGQWSRAHGAYPLGWNGTSVLFLEQTPGTRSDKRTPNRRKENRLPWAILRLALLAVGVAAWLWVYLVQFGIHR